MYPFHRFTPFFYLKKKILTINTKESDRCSPYYSKLITICQRNEEWKNEKSNLSQPFSFLRKKKKKNNIPRLYHPLSFFSRQRQQNKMKWERKNRCEIGNQLATKEGEEDGHTCSSGRHMWIVTSQRNAGNVRLVATDAASMHKREPPRIPRYRHATPLHAVYTPCVVASRTYVRTLGHDGRVRARLPVLSAGTDNRLLPGIQVWVGRSAITFNRAGPFIIAVKYSMDRRTMGVDNELLPSRFSILILSRSRMLGRVVSLINNRSKNDFNRGKCKCSVSAWLNDWRFNVLLSGLE